MEIFRAFGRLALSGVKEAQAGLRRFQEWGQRSAKTIQDLGKRTQEFGLTLTKFLSAGLGVASGAFAFLSGKMADYSRDLDKNSKAMRANLEQTQKLKAAVEGIGGDFNTAASTIASLQDGISHFLLTGGGPMEDFFVKVAKNVGVTAEAFRDLSGPDALQLYYDTLKKASVSEEDLRLGMKALNVDISDLAPLLENGGAELKRFGDEAEAAGTILSDKTVADAKKFGDVIDQVKRELAGLGMQIGADMLPVAMQLAEIFRTQVVPWIRSAADTVRELLQWFAELSPATQGLIAKIALIAAVIGPAVVALGVLISSLGSLIGIATGAMAVFARLGAVGLVPLLPILAKVALAVGALWLAWEGVKLLWPMIQAAFAAIVSGAGWLLSELGSAFAAIPALLAGVVGYFGDMFSGIVGWFAKLPGAVWGYISDMASGVVSKVKGMVSGVIDSLQGLYRVVVGNSIIPDLARDVGKEVTGMADHSILESRRMSAGMIDAMPDDSSAFIRNDMAGGAGRSGAVVNDFRHSIFRDDRDMLNRMRLAGAEATGI